MIKRLSRKAGFLLAVAGAAVVGGATTALVTAAIPSSTDGQAHGCYRNNASFTDAKGTFRVIDSDNNVTCGSGETSLNLAQNTNPALRDNNDQVLGDILEVENEHDMTVYNRSLKRIIPISYLPEFSMYASGYSMSPLFESSDCTGQAYAQTTTPSAIAKTHLFRWHDGTAIVYGQVNDNAAQEPVVISSFLSAVDRVNYTCTSLPGENFSDFPLTIVSLPFNTISGPIKIQ